MPAAFLAVLAVIWWKGAHRPHPSQRESVTLYLKVAAVLLTVTSLLWYWPSVAPHVNNDPARAGILPSVFYLFGGLMLATTFFWVRWRQYPWKKCTPLGVMSMLWCVLAFPVLTFIRLLCMEPFAWR